MSYNLILKVLLFICLQISIFAAPITRTLNKGWNLVSVPVAQDTLVSEWLKSTGLCDNNNPSNCVITRIWNYDDGWFGYTPTNGGELTHFKVNRGYWFLLKEARNYTFDSSNLSLVPLALNTIGWSLVGFANQAPLNLDLDVFSPSNFNIGFSENNIRRLWAYNEGWKGYVPNALSNELIDMQPGIGHWILTQNTETGIIEANNPLVITPTGASGTAALVIGGATSLTPPDITPSIGYVGASANSSVGEGCEIANEDRYARAYSLDGVLLSKDTLSKVCSNNSQVSYEVGFDSETKTYLSTHLDIANSLVIKVEYNKQSVKSLIADSFAEQSSLLSASRLAEQTADSSSTLAVAMVGAELAKKAGVSTERFSLGEANSGLSASPNSLKEIVKKRDIVLKDFNQSVIDGAKEANSIFNLLATKITDINVPNNASNAEATTKISQLMSGKTTDFSSNVNKALNLGARAMELFANQKKAKLNGVFDFSNQEEKITDLAKEFLKLKT